MNRAVLAVVAVAAALTGAPGGTVIAQAAPATHAAPAAPAAQAAPAPALGGPGTCISQWEATIPPYADEAVGHWSINTPPVGCGETGWTRAGCASFNGATKVDVNGGPVTSEIDDAAKCPSAEPQLYKALWIIKDGGPGGANLDCEYWLNGLEVSPPDCDS